ncbi:MAG: hypothetical protein H6708_24795 [Kofleriaceae bacterium]|nr:hypothetical protein [Kofleriaceae bacterium]
MPFPEERVPRLAATAMDDARRAGFAVPDPLVVEQPGRGRVPADGDHPLAGAPRPAARVMRAGTTVGIAFLDATGARREVAGLPPDLRVIAFDPAGERGVVTTGRELYEVDFERGEARRRWGSEVACPSVAVLAPYWVVKTARDLVVLDPRGDEVREVARKRVGGDAVYVALDGAVVATTAWKKEVRFVGLCEGKLHTLATLGGQAGLAWVEPADGEVVLGVSAAGGVRTFFAVHGLDALYEAWARPRRAAAPPGEPHAPAKAPAKAKAKAKAGAGAKPRARKPTLEEVAALPEAPAPPAFDDADARALDGGYVIRNARGDVFATLPPPESPHTQEIVTWKRDGAWQQVRFGYLYPTTLAASPDGALIVVSGKVSARTLTADIALRTADGSHATFRDTKEERALGPSRGYVPLGADDVVVRADKGVEWWTRRDGRLQLLGAVSVPGLVDVDVEPARGLVLARSRNKQRLVVLARRDDALVKLGAFTEAVVEVRVVAGEVFVRDAASGRASRLAL